MTSSSSYVLSTCPGTFAMPGLVFFFKILITLSCIMEYPQICGVSQGVKEGGGIAAEPWANGHSSSYIFTQGNLKGSAGGYNQIACRSNYRIRSSIRGYHSTPKSTPLLIQSCEMRQTVSNLKSSTPP
jgi:hypothetical protein